MRTATIFCREVVRTTDPALTRVRAIYEQTLDAAERIPWEWIIHALDWPPMADRRTHLLTARRERPGRKDQILGFILASFLPRLGGYVSYVAVDPRARGRGVGAFLYKSAVRRLRRTAYAHGYDMPVLLWDSRPPSPREGVEARLNWESRLHLFKKIGAKWIEGVQFNSPNYTNPLSGDVPLEFFLKPVDASPDEFTSGRLRRVVRGLLRRIYRLDLDGDDRELLREYSPLRLATIA